MFFFKPNKNSSQAEDREGEVISEKNNDFDWKQKSPTNFLSSVIEYNVPVRAILIDVREFKNSKTITLLSNLKDEFLIDFMQGVDGRLFELADKSVLLIFRENQQDDIQTLLIRLQFTFHDEMIQSHKLQILETSFVQLYKDKSELEDLYSKVTNIVPFVPKEKEKGMNLICLMISLEEMISLQEEKVLL